MTPPSAGKYAGHVVAALFGTALRRRRCMLPHEVASLVSTAYDAGVLAQQRFTETPKG